MSVAIQWEYKIVSVDELFAENLNTNGKDRWELVTVLRDTAVNAPGQHAEAKKYALIFKRPKL